jgi:benzylsuccinate CoA-transferase BbsE subunit
LEWTRVSESPPPLEGITVLDLSDEFGAYAGRLLAGLGAEVIRVEDGSSHPSPPPHANGTDGRISLFEEWVHSGKTTIEVDPSQADAIERLVSAVDVVIDSRRGRQPGGWATTNPQIVHVVVTPFGWDHSPDWEPVDDLIVLGAGGLLALGGYEDGGPIGAFGGQSCVAAGTFGAVAALVGLIERNITGDGNHADVSAQEAIAQALEDSLPTYALTGNLKEAQGDIAREAGTGIYACADGYVSMVAGRLGTAKAWSSLVEWLDTEHDNGHELKEERWSQFSFRQTDEASHRFREIFEDFASHRTKASLYVEAQHRGIALSPVSDVTDLLDNEQLKSRAFFYEFRHNGLGTNVAVPGPPFRFSRSAQPRIGEARRFDGKSDELLHTLSATVTGAPTAIRRSQV